MKNIPSYPEPFFTRDYVNNNKIDNERITRQNSFGSILENLNIESIMKFLPLLLNKGGGNTLDFIKNISPNAEKIVTAISALGINKGSRKKESLAESEVIDVSELEETK